MLFSFLLFPFPPFSSLSPLTRAASVSDASRGDYNGDVWMAVDRRRTARGVLGLSLNVGVDPPDVMRRDPCAILECWLEPISADPEKSVQQVGEALVRQYEVLQARGKYIACGDPHPETLEQECKRARRAAGMDRVLFHFNGHGVPHCLSHVAAKAPGVKSSGIG